MRTLPRQTRIAAVLAAATALVLSLAGPGAASAATTQGVFTSISAGGAHACGIRVDRTVACWGDNEHGQVGQDEGGIFAVPETVSGLTDVVELSLGETFSLARRSNGTVWSWGADYQGQRGNGSVADPWEYQPPAAVPGLTNVIALAAGSDFALALIQGGTVKSWGSNRYGQLGDGTRRSKTSPVPVSGLTGATAIAAGQAHSLAIVGGGVRAWGENFDGAVGNNTDIDQRTPVGVSGLTSGITAIAAGDGFSLALRSTGRVMAWGNNDFGQLGRGVGNYDSSLIPVQTSGVTNASSIVAGRHSVFAVRADRTVVTWGLNLVSRRLDIYGTYTTPVVLDGITGAAQLSVTDGYGVTLFVRSTSNAVQSWGENDTGTLGNGTVRRPSYLR